MKYAIQFRLVLTAILILSMLSACTSGVLTRSAGEVTGGVGAGLSEYQK